MTRRVLTAAFTILAAAACGKSDAPATTAVQTSATPAAPAGGASTPAGRGADPVTQSLQQLAQGASQPSAGQPLKLIGGDQLQTMLPDVGGWTRQAPKFHERTMGVASFSLAETRYSRDDAEVTLNITDSAMNQLLLAPLSAFVMAGYSERDSRGYTKSISIAGAPAFEKWEQASRHAEVTAIVGNRFIVAGSGRGVDSVDPVRKIVEAVNLTKLAEMR